jgi:hypothetical protein
VTVFAVTAWVALARPRLGLWDWADVIYFPLAAVGVVLLFVSEEQDREIGALQAQEVRLNRLEESLHDSRPDFDAQDIGWRLLDTNYGLIWTEVTLDDACRRAVSFDPPCLRTRESAPLVRAAYQGFTPTGRATESAAATLARVQDFCRRGFLLLDLPQAQSGLTGITLREVKEVLGAAAAVNLAPEDFARARQYEDQLVSELSQIGEEAKNALGLQWDGEVQKAWEDASEFAQNLYLALDFCVRRPEREADQIATLERWNAQVKKVSGRSKAVRDQIETTRSSEPGLLQQSAAFAKANLWPFVLAVVLALKFGATLAKRSSG